MKFAPLALAMTLALSVSPALADTASNASGASATITGQVLDLTAYMLHDHNADAMKGDAMKGDAMKGDAMKGDAMHGDAMAATKCPSTIGVLSNGKIYVLGYPQGSNAAPMADATCKMIGKTATVRGTVYTGYGVTMILLSAMPSP